MSGAVKGEGAVLKSYMTLAAILAMTVAADYVLKVASVRTAPLMTAFFISGAVLYAATAAGWIFLMQQYSLAHIGVLYSSTMILALTAIGHVAFGEAISTRQMAGVIAALLAVYLMETDAG
jgi:drug/metabolite transporter (DMT)-like permease